ncbi:sensor histidine kinase [Fusobacterium mortiferum]|uniref:sensor histidine kinase n=1 Tax=Fusobacterium mortiferum TaxID=850 RepID=UPI00195D20DB|nr:HAMP domain-containing histidine kinase [Fusobacterium mortiferum]
MKIKISLFQKIFSLSIFLIIFTITVSYLFSTFLADSFYINRKKSEILEIVKNAKKLSVDEYIFKDYASELRNKEGINIYVVSKETEDNYYSYSTKKENEDFYQDEDGFHIKQLPFSKVMLLIYREELSDEDILFVTTSLSVMSSHRHEVYSLHMITLVLTMILSIFICRFFTKKITKNISELNRVAKQITNLDFSEEVVLNTSDELNELGKNINIMSKSISSSIENLNSFVSNASHELKTPITVINTHAQALLNGTVNDEKLKKDYYKVILKESKEMSSLVSDLLLISKLSSLEKNIEKEEYSVLTLLHESIEKFELLELQKNIEWEIKLKDFTLFINKKLFKVVIDNLVNNALKYSLEDSIIEVYSIGNGIVFKNPMYLAEKVSVDKLFQPFYRGTSATELNIDGSGLGLSLIKRILDLHSFNYSIEIEENYFKFILTY